MIDIEKIVKEALDSHHDPFLAVLKEINKILPVNAPKWDESTGDTADRKNVKYYVLGYLTAKNLEIDGENWRLKTIEKEKKNALR